MAHELRDLLHEAAAEPAGDLDVDDLRRRSRRARRRRRLATGGGVAAVVALLAVGLLVGVDQLTGPPDVAIDDDRPTLPDVDRQVVAQGTFGDDLGPWTMRAWTRGGNEVCFRGPLASPCLRPNPADRRFLTSVTTGERDGVPVGCVGVAAQPRVATVEVAFTNGTGRLLTSPVDEAGLRFFATCWSGQPPVREINGLDADGQQIASFGSDVTAESTEAATEPESERSGPRVQVTEGTYQGGQQTWTLDAWWTTTDELCLQLRPGQAPDCSPRPTADQPGALPGWDVNTSYDGDQWTGCANGPVGPAAATVELVFSGGRTDRVTPVEADLQPAATVFAHCWTGHRRILGARSLDADGQVLDRLNPELLDRTVDEPLDPAAPWLQLGAGTADADLLRTHEGSQSCESNPDVTVVEIDWPLDAPPDGRDVRQYVRDPDGQLTNRHQAAFSTDTTLPETAEYTGYHTDTSDLFIDPTTADTRVYIVTFDRIEQWPRLAPPLECG